MNCDTADADINEHFDKNTSDFANVTVFDTNFSAAIDQLLLTGKQTSVGIYLNRIVTPLVLLFGLGGNIANLCILSRKSFRRGLNHIERSALTGLLTLSASDLVFCIIGFPQAFLPTSAYAESQDIHKMTGLFYGIYKVPLINIFLFSSTWLIVWISMERYMAVCHPFQARTAIRTRRSTIVYIAIFILSVAINLPLFFTYDVMKGSCYSVVLSAVWRSHSVVFSAHRITWAIFGTFLPLFLLSFCNINILRAVCDADALSDNDGNNRTLSRVTTTLVVMVFMYLILVTPSMILTFLAAYVKFMTQYQYKAFNIAIDVTNFCQAVKFSSNFLLYCVTNKQFRDNVSTKSCKTVSSRTNTPDSSTAKRYQLVGTVVGNHGNTKPSSLTLMK